MKITTLMLASLSFITLRVAADDYQSKTAVEKQAITWRKISENPYGQFPAMTFVPSGNWSVPHVGGTLRDATNLGQAFDHIGDEMPNGRMKIIHAYGSAVAVDFVSSGDHPFSGLFKTGAVGVARLSLGGPFGTTGSFVPGFALKLFVDGQPSKNMHVMEKLEGQNQDQNYFAHTFTNKLPEPASTATKVGAWYFGKFVKNPIYLTVNHVASVEASGRSAFSTVAPHQIYFVPAEGLRISSEGSDFREELSRIPPGTKLYDVYGSLEEGGERILIGSIETRSPFIASEYGDKKLYFQHEGSIRRSFWWGSEIKKP